MSNLFGGSNPLALLEKIRQLKKEVSGFKGVLLWENPNPDDNFAAQDIILGSDDYDMLEFYYKEQANANILLSVKALKSCDTNLFVSTGAASVGPINIARYMRHKSPTVYSAEDGRRSFADQYTTNNAYAIPFKIIGYKSQS